MIVSIVISLNGLLIYVQYGSIPARYSSTGTVQYRAGTVPYPIVLNYIDSHKDYEKITLASTKNVKVARAYKRLSFQRTRRKISDSKAPTSDILRIFTLEMCGRMFR